MKIPDSGPQWPLHFQSQPLALTPLPRCSPLHPTMYFLELTLSKSEKGKVCSQTCECWSPGVPFKIYTWLAPPEKSIVGCLAHGICYMCTLQGLGHSRDSLYLVNAWSRTSSWSRLAVWIISLTIATIFCFFTTSSWPLLRPMWWFPKCPTHNAMHGLTALPPPSK